MWLATVTLGGCGHSYPNAPQQNDKALVMVGRLFGAAVVSSLDTQFWVIQISFSRLVLWLGDPDSRKFKALELAGTMSEVEGWGTHD